VVCNVELALIAAAKLLAIELSVSELVNDNERDLLQSLVLA
jgi:hypothetical protein